MKWILIIVILILVIGVIRRRYKNPWKLFINERSATPLPNSYDLVDKIKVKDIVQQYHIPYFDLVTFVIRLILGFFPVIHLSHLLIRSVND